MASSARPLWGWIAFYLVLVVAGMAASIAAGFKGDLFWLAIGWMIVLGILTRILGLRPPR